MTSLERTHYTLADLTASLALLSLIAQLAMLLIMIISFRELREEILRSAPSDKKDMTELWDLDRGQEKSSESTLNALDVWEELVKE